MIMTNNERLAWQKSLKSGDEVHIHGMYRDLIGKVEKVDPSGIVHADGYRFNKYGYCQTIGYDRIYIYPVTDEIKKKIKTKELITRLNNFQFTVLPLEKLEKIWKIIKEKEE